MTALYYAIMGASMLLTLTGVKRGTALIDDEDFPRVSGHKWCQNWKGYIVASVWDKKNKISRKLWLHREIINAPKGLFVDHINGRFWDCRKENLRLATRNQNRWNVGLTRRNSTGFKGVSIKKNRKTKIYVAHIKINGKSKYLGYYETPEEAHGAYMKEAIFHYGEFANNGTFKAGTEMVTKKGRPRKLIRSDNESGFQGLSYHKGKKRWIIRLQIDGKRKEYGRFKTKDEAIVALKEIKKQYETSTTTST